LYISNYIIATIDACKKNKNQCKFGFPYPQHISKNTTLNNVSNRWEYYRPRYANHNVITYHPTLLLLGGAHMNMLQITSSLWSHYLLKYSMKCESHGCIELDTKNENHLGLQNIYKSTPSKFEYLTFYEYFEKYEFKKVVHPSFQ
jgi:hypothetical protein